MSGIRKLLQTVVFLFGCSGFVSAQTTIVFQGGEGTAADTWTYSPITNAGGPMPPGAVTNYPASGSYSLRAGGGNNAGCSGGANCISGGGATGCLMHGNSIVFNVVNVACLEDVQLSLFHRSHVFCSGNGFDSGERLYFEVSLNGGPWTSVAQVGGFGDYTWSYANNPAGSPSSGIPLVPNPFVYNVPAGTNTFAFRARANINRSDESFYIDDVRLTTSSSYNFPGTAGLWNGNVSTDWNAICNWDSRTLPLATTDVVIPSTAVNICEVLPLSTGTCHDLIIDKSRLAAEYFSSTLNVTGDLIIDTNGELDLSLNLTEGGTLNLAGNWLNQRDASFFHDDGSTVNFNGSLSQNLEVMNGTVESFYKMSLNKPSGQVQLLDDVWIDPLNNGGGAVMLMFVSGRLLLNGHEITVYNSAATAVQRTGGGIISERTDNTSRMSRMIDTGSGNYIFPFIKTTGIYIPFGIEPVSGAMDLATVATYPTPPDNLPWPVTPVAVSNLISGAGLLPDNRDATADRFWHVEIPGSVSANLSFSYAASELPVAPYNNPFTMRAQRYDDATDLWQPYLPGQGAAAYTVSVPGVNAMGTWTLTNEISPLPVTWLDFSVEPANEQNHLRWTTASEINNDYFTAERSPDGIHFAAFATINGSGNTSTPKSYSCVDQDPFSTITYYRILQTDYDGRNSYSIIKAVRNTNLSKGELSIYPNPASDHFFIQCPDDESPSPIIITDGTSRTVFQTNPVECPNGEHGMLRIELPKLVPGVYFVRVGDGKATKLLLHEK